MLRRRLLEALFKFKSSKNALSYDYGIQLPPETIKEYGRFVGSNQSVVNINNETYYALYGKSPAPTKAIGNSNLTNTGTPTSPQTSAYVNIATYNFKTTSNNQNVTFTFKASCENPNDFLGATQLDNSDISNLAVKVTGTESKTYTYNVATAGDHFIKVYYYQHNDDTLSNDNAGYFRMTPYDIVNYSYRYKAPDTQTCALTSYYGWNLASKPAWVKLGKLNNQNQFVEITTDNSGNNDIIIEVQSNPGNSRSGNIVLREKYSGQEVTILVSQGANPHPNDIIVSYGKMTVPQNYTGSNQLNVELIGNTSYTISNVSSGLTVSPMNGNNNTISISNAQGNNVNGSFRITGNAGTVKDIYISKEYSSCYCDCNIFDSCACHINTSFTKKDDTSCPTNNCGANSQISCPKHVENYMNQGNCNGHTACSCDCNAVNKCTCNTNIVCDKDIQGTTSYTLTCSCHSGFTQGTTSYTATCSCHSGFTQGTTSYTVPCGCHSGVIQGTTSYSGTCSCHSGVIQGTTSYSGTCSCHSGYFHVTSCGCNSCNDDTDCYDSKYCKCDTVCKCEGQVDVGCYDYHCSGNTGDNTDCVTDRSHSHDCNSYNTGCSAQWCSPDCKTNTCGDCPSNKDYGWSYCNPTCGCDSNITWCNCHKDIQGTTSYSGTCSCHSGYTQGTTSYSGTCSCHSGFTQGTTSYTVPCGCHSGVIQGTTSYSVPCGCHSGVIQGTTSYTVPCSCHSGYFHETSCHSHDNLCSRNQCNTVNPTSCSCNLKTYYPHCDCDSWCKCDGYYVPCESKASRTTASPCTSYTPNP